MGKETVVDHSQQFAPAKQGNVFFDAPFLRSTISPEQGRDTIAFRGATEHDGASGESRDLLLDKASQIITKSGPFTERDLVQFTKTMLSLAGSFKVGENEHITAVPDRIPRTGVKEISIHQADMPDGASVNIVYQTVGDQQDRRYVIGENFGASKPVSTFHKMNVAATATPLREMRHTSKDAAPVIHLDHRADNPDEADALRREVAMDIYVAHLADEELIERSIDAADTVRELLHQGTPITELNSVK